MLAAGLPDAVCNSATQLSPTGRRTPASNAAPATRGRMRLPVAADPRHHKQEHPVVATRPEPSLVSGPSHSAHLDGRTSRRDHTLAHGTETDRSKLKWSVVDRGPAG